MPNHLFACFLAVASFCLPAGAFAIPFPVISPFENPDAEASHGIDWATEPGVLYELQQSVDLETWISTSGFPREAEGVNDRHEFLLEGDRMFFRVREFQQQPAPAGFEYIPSGTYSRGDHMNDPESWMSRSRPVQEVYVSGFFMAKTPVTHGEWQAVYTWAMANGYVFENTGQRGCDANFEALPPTAANDLHPVVQINWYDMVKWCNARSEMEGFTPIYYLDDARTFVYKAGRHDVTDVQVDWDADGYRLPTSTEWEKAARGGLERKRWFWGDEPVDASRVNYRDGTNAIGTTPVGSYAPNYHSLYDMAGNVWERCWDWYNSGWYYNAGASEPDSRGPTSGVYRVVRGGSWNYRVEYGRVGYFGADEPDTRGRSWGFRVARTAIP